MCGRGCPMLRRLLGMSGLLGVSGLLEVPGLFDLPGLLALSASSSSYSFSDLPGLPG